MTRPVQIALGVMLLFAIGGVGYAAGIYVHTANSVPNTAAVVPVASSEATTTTAVTPTKTTVVTPTTATPKTTTTSTSVTVTPAVPTTPSVVSYTLAQVAQHSSAKDCWSAVNGKVYNVTSFISKHPGGAGAVISSCGTDASAAFNGERAHTRSGTAETLAQYYVGDLAN